MTKPKTIGGYSPAVTEGCERVLVTLLRGFGPWKESVFLVGGLTPRYLVTSRPPVVPEHAGTGDVDIVVDIAVLADTKAYRSLEENLKAMNFAPLSNDRGVLSKWRWRTKLENGAVMILEFLTDAPDKAGSEVKVLETGGRVGALNIPHSAMVFDLHQSVDITAELIGDQGLATETVRFADVVSFTCLKAFAYDQRQERKDAHDLTYCLEHAKGGSEAVLSAFARGLETKHRGTILEALGRLAARFCDDGRGAGYLKDGPVAAARFEGDDRGDEDRDARILRQREVSDVVSRIVLPLLAEHRLA